MAYTNINKETEYLGNRQFRHTIHLRPVAYPKDGGLVAINQNWGDGDATWTNIVEASHIKVRCGTAGNRRILPTDDPNAYIEIGRPYVKVGGVWTQVSLNAFTRSGNLITSVNTNANIYIYHIGHAVKLAIRLKNGWVPEDNLVAFPVALVGLTRSGGNILRNGKLVGRISPPFVFDFNEPGDHRPISWDIVTLSGQPYILLTLPDLTGMGIPVIDPTFTDQGTTGQDTYMASNATTTNFGADNYMRIGELSWAGNICRALLKFDLSSIPATATIDSAVLHTWLKDSGTTNSSTNSTHRLYRVRNSRDWVETEATYTIFKTSNNWTTAGCGSTASDREDTILAECPYLTSGAANAEFDFTWNASGLAQIAAWTAGTVENNGMLAKSPVEIDDAFSIHSSEATTAGYRPKMVINYTEAVSVLGTPIFFE